METYFERYREQSEHLALELNKEKGQLYMLVPSSGKGSYASQPCGILMEIVIQPHIDIIHSSMANTHAKQYRELKPIS